MSPSPSSPPQPPPQISHHQHNNNNDPPLGVPLLLPAPPLPQPPPPPSSRRLPPPCWTPDETSALIDAYRDKWYSLRRGNLRAAHWQEVADDIHRLCPNVSPPKTAVQCRHKMEKLRKRYRAELQRAKSIPHHRFSSSWVYFSKMDDMEKGNNNNNNNVIASVPPVNVVFNDDLVKNSNNCGFDADFDNDNDDEDDVGDDDDYNSRTPFRKDFQRNGLKIRIAGNSRKNYGGFEQISNPNPNPNPRFGRYNEFATPPQFEEGVRFATRVLKNDGYGSSGGGGSSSAMGVGTGMNVMTKKKRSALGKRVRDEERGKGRDGSAVMEMVEAIRVMGDGFMRVEKMKMDMVRESERERMEHELKRTQMILESQRRIVEAFAKGWSEVIISHENDEDHDNEDDDNDDKNNNKDEP